MLHILASIGFALVALVTFGLTALMLASARREIAQALGVSAPVSAAPLRRPVRIRSAGRWQAAMDRPAQPRRAAA